MEYREYVVRIPVCTRLFLPLTHSAKTGTGTHPAYDSKGAGFHSQGVKMAGA